MLRRKRRPREMQAGDIMHVEDVDWWNDLPIAFELDIMPMSLLLYFRFQDVPDAEIPPPLNGLKALGEAIKRARGGDAPPVVQRGFA